jgi:2-succinyl-5-enolpyruvyl-6-hydroxy-3-cyclohexene-1-carboxylate synthase
MMALDASSAIHSTVVIDERSAAFIALGKASITERPVVLVCTSGTALLNYAPAVAEAYYRKVPLIVVSADRPMEWIDQDDSQTLRQYEALANYVKGNYNIPADCSSSTMQWYVNRVVNDALLTAVTGRCAPVHINIQLDAPLSGVSDDVTTRWTRRSIDMISPSATLSPTDVQRLTGELAAARKVLIIAGFHNPNVRLRGLLERLTMRGNIAVMTETISNVYSSRFINGIDSVLCTLSEEQLDELRPDVVITFGGAIVSRFIKQYLRRKTPAAHWHVGVSDTTIDCFQALTRRIDMDAEPFFAEVVEAIEKVASDTDMLHSAEHRATSYYDAWRACDAIAGEIHNRYVAAAPWSDLRAVATLLKHMPCDTSLQLSNGTSVRYAQLFPPLQCRRTDCNRGVSGIDGSTSTAIGAASAQPEAMTLLLTGDMSAQYDVGALAAPCIPPTFRMAVLCNGGGGIFRFIDATRTLPILNRYLVAERRFPLKELAGAYGFKYMEVDSEEALLRTLPSFFAPSDAPVILAIHTPGEVSADILREYFRAR